MFGGESTPFRFNFGGAQEDRAETTAAEVSAGDSPAAPPLPAGELVLASTVDAARTSAAAGTTSAIEAGDELMFREKGAWDATAVGAGPDASSSDLVPQVYEGGFKLWECAIDAIDYLQARHQEQLYGARVMDLGCGHAIPAIYALRRGATFVCCQDYNEQVLCRVTLPNFFHNELEGALDGSRARFFYGDWGSFASSFAHDLGKFDFIISADTVYNPQNYDKVIQCIDTFLAENGVAIIAAKSYYFGVGGSVDGFLAALEHNERLTGTVAAIAEDKNSNIRKIVIVERISDT